MGLAVALVAEHSAGALVQVFARLFPCAPFTFNAECNRAGPRAMGKHSSGLPASAARMLALRVCDVRFILWECSERKPKKATKAQCPPKQRYEAERPQEEWAGHHQDHRNDDMN